ncbi:hypothetical protein [Domibacillus robiginosus]|uniref:hypothetical protein n=1 Tax=Domibacillus robiginosus TaxID=1071054 RepID=UPI0012E0A0D0|nr:hypothetical protein [Domibacillus robiginosus]
MAAEAERRLREEAAAAAAEAERRLREEAAAAAAEAERRLREEAAAAAAEAERRLREEAAAVAAAAAAEAERRLREEVAAAAAAAAAEAERRLREEVTRGVNEAKNRIQDAINSGADSLNPQDVAKVLEHFKEHIPLEITEKGKEYVAKLDEVKNKLQELQSALDINTIKREILHKAEEFCEAYLKEKLGFLPSISLKGIPKVKLDFNGQEITADIKVFIMPSDREESEYESQWLVSLNVNITQDVTKLEVPEFVLNIEPNRDWAQDRLEEIRQQLENKKDELIAQLIASILQDYMPPLRALNEAIKLFK